MMVTNMATVKEQKQRSLSCAIETQPYYFSARIVQLAKTKAITHFLTHARAFLESHFSHATQKLGNSSVPYCKRKNAVELKHFKTPSSYKVYNLMKLKP